MVVNVVGPSGRQVAVNIPSGVRTGDLFTAIDPFAVPNGAAPVQMMPMSIRVPPGDHTRAQTITLQLADGRSVSATIPAGVRTGDQTTVMVPGPIYAAPPQQFAPQYAPQYAPQQFAPQYAPAPQPTTMQVVVPPGDHTRAQQVMVVSPTGQQVMVTIPAGVGTGKTITVQIPAPQQAPQQQFAPGMQPQYAPQQQMQPQYAPQQQMQPQYAPQQQMQPQYAPQQQMSYAPMPPQQQIPPALVATATPIYDNNAAPVPLSTAVSEYDAVPDYAKKEQPPAPVADVYAASSNAYSAPPTAYPAPPSNNAPVSDPYAAAAAPLNIPSSAAYVPASNPYATNGQ